MEKELLKEDLEVALHTADRFYLYGIKVDFLKDVLKLFEKTVEYCKINKKGGYEAGLYFCDGIKTLLKLAEIYNWTEIESKDFFQNKQNDIIDKLLNIKKD